MAETYLRIPWWFVIKFACEFYRRSYQLWLWGMLKEDPREVLGDALMVNARGRATQILSWVKLIKSFHHLATNEIVLGRINEKSRFTFVLLKKYRPSFSMSSFFFFLLLVFVIFSLFIFAFYFCFLSFLSFHTWRKTPDRSSHELLYSKRYIILLTKWLCNRFFFFTLSMFIQICIKCSRQRVTRELINKKKCSHTFDIYFVIPRFNVVLSLSLSLTHSLTHSMS